MAMRTRLGTGVFLICFAAPALAHARAADVSSDSEQALRSADAGYWRAFDGCDAAGMGPYLAEDLEFYHDKSVSLGRVPQWSMQP